MAVYCVVVVVYRIIIKVPKNLRCTYQQFVAVKRLVEREQAEALTQHINKFDGTDSQKTRALRMGPQRIISALVVPLGV